MTAARSWPWYLYLLFVIWNICENIKSFRTNFVNSCSRNFMGPSWKQQQVQVRTEWKNKKKTKQRNSKTTFASRWLQLNYCKAQSAQLSPSTVHVLANHEDSQMGTLLSQRLPCTGTTDNHHRWISPYIARLWRANSESWSMSVTPGPLTMHHNVSVLQREAWFTS